MPAAPSSRQGAIVGAVGAQHAMPRSSSCPAGRGQWLSPRDVEFEADVVA
ncbi:MAG: hypothetical protein K6U11_14525 [bacterium]|nr:hypothetical protein [bacterium]